MLLYLSGITVGGSTNIVEQFHLVETQFHYSVPWASLSVSLNIIVTYLMIFDPLEPVVYQVDSCQRMLLERTCYILEFPVTPELAGNRVHNCLWHEFDMLPCCMVGLLCIIFSQSY